MGTDASAGADAGTPRDIRALELLLTEGWQVEPPVIARHSWPGGQSSAWDYHFIIASGARRSLVVLPESDELRGYCASQGLTVTFPPPEAPKRARRLTLKTSVS
jgi:hypothetical protein